MTTAEFPELGFYALAGQPASSRDVLTEVRDGEALGLGSVFISERYNKKEAAALCGAAAAASESITIACGVTNSNTRHPLVTAGFAYTMQSLTGGRFVLGIGRGIPILQQIMGIPGITTAEMEDFAGIMRRQPRRSGGPLPVAAARPDSRRAPADEHRGLRREHPAPRRALLRRGDPAHVLRG